MDGGPQPAQVKIVKKPSDAFEFIGQGARLHLYRKGWICWMPLVKKTKVNCHTSIKLEAVWLANLLIAVWSTMKMISASPLYPAWQENFDVSFWCSRKGDGWNFRVKDLNTACYLGISECIRRDLHLSIFTLVLENIFVNFSRPSQTMSVQFHKFRIIQS